MIKKIIGIIPLFLAIAPLFADDGKVTVQLGEDVNIPQLLNNDISKIKSLDQDNLFNEEIYIGLDTPLSDDGWGLRTGPECNLNYNSGSNPQEAAQRLLFPPAFSFVMMAYWRHLNRPAGFDMELQWEVAPNFSYMSDFPSGQTFTNDALMESFGLTLGYFAPDQNAFTLTGAIRSMENGLLTNPKQFETTFQISDPFSLDVSVGCETRFAEGPIFDMELHSFVLGPIGAVANTNEFTLGIKYDFELTFIKNPTYYSNTRIFQ